MIYLPQIDACSRLVGTATYCHILLWLS